LVRVDPEEQKQFEWARGLNPKPGVPRIPTNALRRMGETADWLKDPAIVRVVRTPKEETLIERGLRLLSGRSLPSVVAEDDIEDKRRKAKLAERKRLGIETIGGM
jgi:hypothetical protein